jgi:hypothetical protein
MSEKDKTGVVGRNHWVMDIETLVNCSIFCFEHYKTNIQHSFIVNRHINQFDDLIKFLQYNIQFSEWHISYNGLGFDAQVVQHLIDNSKKLSLLTADELTKYISDYATQIINLSKSKMFLPYAPWKLKIKQIDLFKMNHWDNPAKSSSLKWIQYSMDWHNVEEMPIHHTEMIDTDEKLDMVLQYCWNDVKSTKEIYRYSMEQVQLRKSLTEEYGIDLYSASEPRISKELFGKFLAPKMGIEIKELKQLRTHRYNVLGKDIIVPGVNFKTVQFQALHDWAKGLDIDFHSNLNKQDRDLRYKFNLNYKGMTTYYGLGGIHGARDAGVYEASTTMIIMTSDVQSYYPNLAIRNKWSPEHIPKHIFCEQYEWFFDERLKLPKTDPRNYVYKIILNATYGLSSEKNCFLYDPLFTMQITINGQLLLSMLYEMLAERIPGCIPLMQNTDGLEMMIPINFKQTYLDICAEWEQNTMLKLEHDEYKKMIIGDVNNYVAVNTAGKVKAKGRFEWEDQDKKKVAYFHKNKSFLIIPKAINAYFIDGIIPEDYLKSNRNIFDYCGGAKAKGDWRFQIDKIEDGYLKVEKLQKLVRYYISKKGHKMLKVNQVDGRRQQIEAGRFMQIPANDMTNMKSFDDYEVDESYYLEAIYKEINNIEKGTRTVTRTHTQLKMF